MIFLELEKLKDKIKEYKKIVIFGAGISGIFAYQYIKKNEKEILDGAEVIAFFDNDPKKKNNDEFKKKYGIPCVSPKEFEYNEKILILNTVRRRKKEIFDQYNKKLSGGRQNFCITSDAYIYCMEIEKLQFLYDSLECKSSKKVLRKILKASLSDDNTEYEKIYNENQYFALPQFTNVGIDDIFVDCGAYVGDTIERYIFNRLGVFNKIYAFEPGEKQREAMQYRIERLKKEWALEDNAIIVVPSALGEKNRQTKMNGTKSLMGYNLLVENTEYDVELINCVTLDDFFSGIEEKPTFIKVDVEGYELELLKGARNIIEKEKPLLALSVYHKPEDLWEIFDFIRGIRSDYKFDLLHHSAFEAETVLYCY